MSNFVNDVVEIIRQRNDRGEYLVIKVRKEDGEILEKKVFGEAVRDFTVPGKYDCEMEKRKLKTGGTAWSITAARLVDAPNPADPQRLQAQTGTQASSEIYRNDAITSQVAIKAAADITVAAIAKSTSTVTAESAKDFVCIIAEALIISATVAHAKKEKEVKEDEPVPF